MTDNIIITPGRGEGIFVSEPSLSHQLKTHLSHKDLAIAGEPAQPQLIDAFAEYAAHRYAYEKDPVKGEKGLASARDALVKELKQTLKETDDLIRFGQAVTVAIVPFFEKKHIDTDFLPDFGAVVKRALKYNASDMVQAGNDWRAAQKSRWDAEGRSR